jgi:hypothetical protein
VVSWNRFSRIDFDHKWNQQLNSTLKLKLGEAANHISTVFPVDSILDIQHHDCIKTAAGNGRL